MEALTSIPADERILEGNMIYRGTRCGTCYWALYDGHQCQNPTCQHYRTDPVDTVKLSNREAAVLIARKQEDKNWSAGDRSNEDDIPVNHPAYRKK